MADSPRLRHRRLTVVDDSPEVLELLGEILRLDGAEVATFDSAVTLTSVEASAPDLVMVGLRLGGDGMIGLNLIRGLRAHPELRRTPIIVCSAAFDDLAEHAEELGRLPLVSILPKPFSLDAFEACVSAALAGGPDAEPRVATAAGAGPGPN